MKSFIIALVCLATAYADVSELLLQPVPHQHHTEEHHLPEARPFDILAEQEPSTLEFVSEAVHVEEPAAVGFGLANDGVEIVEAIEVLPVVDGELQRVQLTESHQDYQGPYHYEKPKVQLDYGAPIVVEKVPEVETPIIVKDQPVDNSYLPPKYTQDNLVKRHVKYIVRRRV